LFRASGLRTQDVRSQWYAECMQSFAKKKLEHSPMLVDTPSPRLQSVLRYCCSLGTYRTAITRGEVVVADPYGTTSHLLLHNLLNQSTLLFRFHFKSYDTQCSHYTIYIYKEKKSLHWLERVTVFSACRVCSTSASRAPIFFHFSF
jgi:hypothetical protein